MLLKHTMGAPVLGSPAPSGVQLATMPADCDGGRGSGWRAEGRVTAKVADFGLSLMVDPAETHVSHMHGVGRGSSGAQPRRVGGQGTWR